MLNTTDIVIIGGGIAGLWALNELKHLGYNVILLETDALGAGQTIKSQGIIHGGLKYALSGNLNSAANALKDMPTYWQKCLDGTGEIDLSKVQVLAKGQHMWSTNKLIGGITTLFASSALNSQVQTLNKDQWPKPLRNSAAQGKVYRVEELVLNVPSLLKALATPYLNCCIKIDDPEQCKLELDALNNIRQINVTVNNQQIKITAQRYIFTAGTGNEDLIRPLYKNPIMQRRPLHMVLVKSHNLSPLYGHCVGLSSTPRITITTHIAKDGEPVWYLGGKLAEDGVNVDPAKQQEIARQELASIFPKLDLNQATWASFYVDRAEEKQADGSKPNSTTALAQNNFITAWPTKLAMAPILAKQIFEILQTQNIQPTPKLAAASLDSLPQPEIAEPIWDQLL
jgi:hypothetical protein